MQNKQKEAKQGFFFLEKFDFQKKKQYNRKSGAKQLAKMRFINMFNKSSIGEK